MTAPPDPVGVRLAEALCQLDEVEYQLRRIGSLGVLDPRLQRARQATALAFLEVHDAKADHERQP